MVPSEHLATFSQMQNLDLEIITIDAQIISTNFLRDFGGITDSEACLVKTFAQNLPVILAHSLFAGHLNTVFWIEASMRHSLILDISGETHV